MGKLAIKVIPGARCTDIEVHNTEGQSAGSLQMANAPQLTVRLSEPPIEGRATIALIKLLTKLSGFKVQVIAGAAARRKVIAFDADEATFLASLKEGAKSLRK